YLEGHWGDVHTSLVAYARDQLQASLPSDLRARAQERRFLESFEGNGRSIYPDVRVVERGRQTAGTAVLETEIAVAEPIILLAQSDPITESYIEITEVGSGNRLVTAIEFLSPSKQRKRRRPKTLSEEAKRS